MRTRRRLLAVLAAALISALVMAASAAAQAPSGPPYNVIASNGFNQPNNDYAWSMAWFNGQLYVGTARSEECVEQATEAFYYPQYFSLAYQTNPLPSTSCPANEYDLNLQAQIWRYTPQTATWELVYNSPQDIPNPRAAGKFVSRDLAFRGMVVYNNQLYVGDVTPDEYIPELADSEPPRILRTSDGVHWAPFDAPSTIDTYLGVQKPIGFRAMDVYNGNLYVTISSGLTGDGVIERVDNAGSANPSFTQVSDPSMQVFEMQPFNGQLYAGDGSSANAGYSVYRSDLSTSPPTWTPVVTDGAGLGAAITSVVSMQVFNNQLFVGSSGWYNTLFPASEMIAIYPNDQWDLVSGTPRTVDGVQKNPTSGLPNGFGNAFNAHFWRMDTYAGGLYVGTNDWSWVLQNVPILNILLYPQYGFDVYGTCDGRNWFPVTYNAFGGGIDNFGGRTMVNTPSGNFIGSANHAQGTTIYQSTPAADTCGGSLTPAATAASTAGTAHAAGAATATLARPRAVRTDVQRCGTVVSWQRAPGAARYEVLRETPRTYVVPKPRRQLLPGGVVPDQPTGLTSASGNLTITGTPTAIGTTTKPYFVDRGAPPGSVYEVIAKSASGAASGPSNLAAAPSLSGPSTFAAARSALKVPAHGRGRASAASVGASGLLRLAQRQWSGGDRTGAITSLTQLQHTLATSANASRVTNLPSRADLEALVSRLARRLQYAGAACRAR
jgi:hypothetical protein